MKASHSRNRVGLSYRYKNRPVRTITCIAASIGIWCIPIFSNPVFAWQTGSPGYTHQRIALEAARLWPGCTKPLSHPFKAEFCNPDQFGPWIIDGPIGDPDEGTMLTEGVYEADHPFLTPLNHFWNPDNQQDPYNDGILPGGQLADSAWVTAANTWEAAIVAYRQGNQGIAYYRLGEVVHLLSDMGVPYHVRNYPHLPGECTLLSECFEPWANARNMDSVPWESALPPDYETAGTNNSVSVLPEDGGLGALFQLFYNMAQRTDSEYSHLASWPDKEGDILDRYGAPHAEWLGSDTIPPYELDDYVRQSDVLLPRAAQYVASLFRLFYSFTHFQITNVTSTVAPPYIYPIAKPGEGVAGGATRVEFFWQISEDMVTWGPLVSEGTDRSSNPWMGAINLTGVLDNSYIRVVAVPYMEIEAPGFLRKEIEGPAAYKIAQVRSTPCPSLAIGGPYAARPGEAIQFQAGIAGGSPPYTYLWMFGDGGSSTANPVNHTYTNEGVFSVTFSVSDATGCDVADSTFAEIATGPQEYGCLEVRATTEDGSGIGGARIYVDGQDTGRTTPNQICGLWSGRHYVRTVKPCFGDGIESATVETTTVRQVNVLMIREIRPVITVDQPIVPVGQPICFDGRFSYPADKVNSYCWRDLGGNNCIPESLSCGPQICHAFSQPCVREVQLELEDSCGGQVSDVAQVNIFDESSCALETCGDGIDNDCDGRTDEGCGSITISRPLSQPGDSCIGGSFYEPPGAISNPFTCSRSLNDPFEACDPGQTLWFQSFPYSPEEISEAISASLRICNTYCAGDEGGSVPAWLNLSSLGCVVNGGNETCQFVYDEYLTINFDTNQFQELCSEYPINISILDAPFSLNLAKTAARTVDATQLRLNPNEFKLSLTYSSPGAQVVIGASDDDGNLLCPLVWIKPLTSPYPIPVDLGSLDCTASLDVAADEWYTALFGDIPDYTTPEPITFRPRQNALDITGVYVTTPHCTPTVELCDAIDNNCDGQVDEGDPEGGSVCDTGESGVCAAGTVHCHGGMLECVPNASVPEICDGLDNDCDGSVDEDYGNRDGDLLGDFCDNCPTARNDDQADYDNDGIGNACMDPAVNANLNNVGSSMCRIDGWDLFPLARAFGKAVGVLGYDPASDLNRDGLIDGMDVSILQAVWAEVIPSSVCQSL